MSCAAALSVMEVVERDGLIQHAKEVGEYTLARLKTLKDKHKNIGDVRGVGLFIGVELVENKVSKVPATALAQHVITE